MKVFSTTAVLLVLSAVTLGQEYSEAERKRIAKNREDCIIETKVNPELIDRADKGDFVDDEKFKCFTKCFYQKAGFVTESGGLVLEAIRSKIPSHVDKEKALKVIGLCQKEGKDACETVYLIHKCYFENMQKHAERTQKENQSQSQSGSNKETGKQ